MGKFDWKSIVKGAAPILGMALPGPFGAIAQGLIGAALGDENMDEKVIEAKLRTADPETILKIKQAEIAFKQFMREAELKEQDLLSESDKAQVELNKIEAKSPSLFKSGWRPATGWTCVAGLIYQFLFNPIFTWITTLLYFLISEAGKVPVDFPTPPDLNMETLISLMTGLLGLGVYRTYEKRTGVDKSR